MFWNKRKRLHKKWVRLSQDWFGTPTWPPFHCFGTPIWPPFHCFGTLIRPSWLGLLQGTGKQNRQIADRRVPRSQKQLCRTSSVIQSHSRFLSGESVSAVRTCFEIWFVHLNRRHLPRLQAIPTSLLVHYSKKRRTRRCRRTSRCAGRERGSFLAVMSASSAMHIVHPKPESAKMELKMPAWDVT